MVLTPGHQRRKVRSVPQKKVTLSLGSSANSSAPSTKMVTFHITPDLDRAIELFAARRGWKKSRMITWALLRVPEIRGYAKEESK